MTVRLIVSLATILIAAIGLASAQEKAIPGKSPPAKQSAPSESSHAPGHDAQSGKPDTGEKTKGQGGDKKTNGAEKKEPAKPMSPK